MSRERSDFMQVLTERLFALRKERNWSQETAAKNFGVPFRTYRRYELGEREAPFSIVVRIAEFYDISLDYLAGRTDVREVAK